MPEVCDRCGNRDMLSYRVRSDLIDMIVCLSCAAVARELKLMGMEGEISVEFFGDWMR